MFACCNGLFANSSEAQKIVIVRIAEVELSVSLFGAFPQAVRIGPMRQLSYRQLIEASYGHSVLMCGSKVMILK